MYSTVYTLDCVIAYTSPIVQCSPLHQKSSEWASAFQWSASPESFSHLLFAHTIQSLFFNVKTCTAGGGTRNSTAISDLHLTGIMHEMMKYVDFVR